MKGPAAPVVVGVDGSSSALFAVKWAAAECARHHAPLRLVHAYSLPLRGYPEIILTGQEIRRAIEEQAGGWLSDAAAVARGVASEVEITTELRCDGVITMLIEESRNARLMVLGSQGLGNITGLLVGSTAIAMASHGKCPLVVVRGTEFPTGPVVVGVDGSPTSEAALAFAFETASMRDAPLTVVMCWHDFMIESAYTASRFTVDWGQVEEAEQRLLAERLAGFQDKYPDVQVHRVVVRDRPVRALMRYGSEAQLLVVGSHGHGGFAGMLLGSTSQALVYNSPCPLAIVRPD
ncbi:universal stress protein [Lentzea sp. NBC_00516]|uniref:Universal stress protein n=1 Tax=Lentzea sokolovensis TaxID=3095429 RepID=A0ABU4URJ8_9PSEU|nr:MULTISPECIES: universal stress protein [unclassified Lentzea]MDX8141421.1 universal stress protein [Lentzea sp. BCCO 10_0061]WUD27244.1 universal stress protein [Lentzea sp. NBC_00516]